jgi:hypothetical protein
MKTESISLALVAMVALVAIIGMSFLIDSPSIISQVEVVSEPNYQEVAFEDPAIEQWSKEVENKDQLDPSDIESLISILEKNDDPYAQLMAKDLQSTLDTERNLYGFATDGPLSFVPDEFSYENKRVYYSTGDRSYGVGKVGKGWGVSVKFRF